MTILGSKKHAFVDWPNMKFERRKEAYGSGRMVYWFPAAVTSFY